MRSTSAKILFGTVGFLLGFLCCKTFTERAGLNFDPKLTLGDVVSAVTTLLVAVLLASYLQRQTASDRAEKEIVLRNLDIVLAGVTALEKFKGGGAVAEIAASLKTLSMNCQAAHELLVHLEYPEDVSNELVLDHSIKALRKLATETSIRRQDDHAIGDEPVTTVRAGVIHLSGETRVLLEGKIQQMKMDILKAQISVNRV